MQRWVSFPMPTTTVSSDGVKRRRVKYHGKINKRTPIIFAFYFAIWWHTHNTSIIENRRLLQDRGILSRIFDTAATVRRQVGGDAG